MASSGRTARWPALKAGLLRRGGLAAMAAAAGVTAASPAAAHGFGQRFDLPLPLSFWVTGAGLSIVLSFVVMAIFVRERPAGAGYPAVELTRIGFFRALTGPVSVAIFRAIGVVLFLVTLGAGFLGIQSSLTNLIVPMIWVIWWVGVAFICSLVGNLWDLANPFRALFQLAERGFALVSGGRSLSLNLGYPSWLGAWPAVLFFFGFAWLELVWGESDIPASLARVMLTYTLITLAGMVLFGREVWLRQGEAFSIAFGVLARFAPLHSPREPDREGRTRLQLRPPGAGLMDYSAVTASLLVFVLLMLSTVTFDGFIETPMYRDISRAVFGTPWTSNLLFDLSETIGLAEREILLTGMLILFPLAFILVFWAGSWIMVRVTRLWGGRGSRARDIGGGRAAIAFVLTLVPIAVAYHLSHYFTYLVTQSAYVLRPASDPFNQGWNLFGTATFTPGVGTMNPYVYWYLAVAVIIIGHVIAVYLAHVVALRVFGTRRAALVSQVPMVILMVLYTTLSLWILAQPIVG